MQNSTVTIIFEGQSLAVSAHLNVAEAVLGHTHNHITYTGTHPLDGRHRAPYCLMGVCFECLMVIDNVENVQACLTPVREGMLIKRQTRRVDTPEADHDQAC